MLTAESKVLWECEQTWLLVDEMLEKDLAGLSICVWHKPPFLWVVCIFSQEEFRLNQGSMCKGRG